MQITEAELRTLLLANPSLRVHEIGSAISRGASVKKADSEKPRKYRNQKVYLYADGFADIEMKSEKHGNVVAVYDSRKEFRRHMELQALEQAGEIHELQRQYPLIVQSAFVYQGKKIRAITYKADFCYRKGEDESITVEDVKGIDKATGKHITTAEFRLKWKLLKYKYPDLNFVLY